MSNVAAFADEFVSRSRRGEKPSVFVAKSHLKTFLGMLAREGIAFAKECLAEITDPSIREIVETIFFASLAGAGAGALVGGILAGPPGAQVGAAVGTAVGFAAGCIAVTIRATPKKDGLLISVQ